MFHFILLLCSQFITPSYFSPIVGGYIVISEGFPKYPFIVSLQERFSEIENKNVFYYKHFCGGSLLNSKWILSAAHCLWSKNITNVFAVVGYENITNVLDDHLFPIKRVEYFFFRPSSMENDIALLRLESSYNIIDFSFRKGDLFGKLPSYGMKAYRKQPCKIIGFGGLQHAGLMQEQLHEADVYVITNKFCRSSLGHVWAPQKGDNKVCALGVAQDTCQGDSGGPLICKFHGENYIYGIISHGVTCSMAGIPSIYTITGPYNQWVNTVIKK